MSSTEYHEALSPLSWLFGVWESVEAEVFYPTIKTVKYDEVMEYLPTMQPVLEYKSETFHPVEKTKIHCERGFLKIDPESKKIALAISHHVAINELAEGSIEDKSLCLEGQSFARASIMKCPDILKTVRKLSLKGDLLYYTVDMETSNQPLQPHVRTIFRKKM